MSERTLLRRNFQYAWEATMAPYGEGIINSERGLQIHFVHRLFEEFVRSGVRRRIFVEPCFRDNRRQQRSPDLVICNSIGIIGVIELKYLPRIQPKYAKDLRTLEWFATAGDTISVSNQRYLGPELQVRELFVLPDAVLCWAGIYRSPKVAMKLPDGLSSDRLFRMHALTAEGTPPTIIIDDD